ncbi:MAG: helix-turn-helix transcriptional regulator [Synechococcaceae cyanobacterium]|nr:helix-turn-helix transcriptional regulator [Synechococcaceae cyanobacterium]
MGAPVRPPLIPLPPPVLPPPVARLAGRLRRRLRGTPPLAPGADGPRAPADPLLQAGQQLRAAREAEGLGLRQLAQETRISTPVLEALEKGWRERLPEAAYLRTMVPLLEQRLHLQPGSLDAALPPERLRPHAPRREPLLRRFTPGSIDVFTTWQGTLLYGALTLLLIYALNLQQQRLALEGLLTARPLPALAPAQEAAASAEAADALLLQAYPELQPLRGAARGQALRRLRAESRRTVATDLSLGRLELHLEQPTRLRLWGPRDRPSELQDSRGRLSLPVLPPFQLRLDPAPPAGAVRWRGRVLEPEAGDPGRFRYPPAVPAGPRASGARPQREAMAP